MKSFARLLLILFFFAGATARGETPDDACEALRSARIHLVALMGTSDQASQDNHRKHIQAASARMDAVLLAMSLGRQADDAAKARAFQGTWEAFKNTRETEIIPAVLAGRRDVARTIALGIQGERMAKLKATMGCK